MIIGVSACSDKTISNSINSRALLDSVATHTDRVKDRGTCTDAVYYAPYDKLLHPMRYIRVNVHYMNDESNKYNFVEGNGKGEEFFKILLENANDRLMRNNKMALPHGNETPALVPQYQYVLTPSGEGDSGIFYHSDNEHAFFVNKGRNKNNYNRDLIKKYAVRADSILNIFVLPHHPDSLATGKYKATNTGIALGTSLKIAGMAETQEKPWEYATLLNHEIGHIFGLRHSWYKNDGCDDTPEHPNCWSANGTERCPDPVSNNMMDYNSSQMAITPCQLGIVHRNIANINADVRGLVIANWCTLDLSKNITIQEPTEWKSALDLSNNIIIKSGASLTIHCRVSMPKGSSITVEPGAQLVLNNNTLHNACGDLWEGIILQENKENKGSIECIGNVKMLDVIGDKDNTLMEP